MTGRSNPAGDTARGRGETGGAARGPRPTRRGVLLGAGLAGLGGALAGCSTAAVPYDADEAGVVPGPSPSGMAGSRMMSSPGVRTGVMPGSGDRPAAGAGRPEKGALGPEVTGTVLGAASDIPVGGGKIYPAARVVVTQPVRGQYQGFSAVCTHVGCILSEVADGTIDCPCHGSEFTISTGAVVTGPAPRPLPKKQVKIVDGKVVLL
jgi:nitrite reductase/ring-hydroxylating ferredoxin subunit